MQAIMTNSTYKGRHKDKDRDRDMDGRTENAMGGTMDIDFITYDDFRRHVKDTLDEYRRNDRSVDFDRFRNNDIDAVKLVFDQAADDDKWSNVIRNEIQRKRDKARNNTIGYFHQNIFRYIHDPRGHCVCKVFGNGETGYDLLVKFGKDHEYTIQDDNSKPPLKISNLYVEMKNKYNTMNNSAIKAEFEMMKSTLLKDSYAACAVVQVMPKGDGADVMWTAQRNGNHKIRLMGIRTLMELVTGEPDAFEKVCTALPTVLAEVSETTEEMEDNVLNGLNDYIRDKRWSTVKDEHAYEYALMDIGFRRYGFDILDSVPHDGPHINWAKPTGDGK